MTETVRIFILALALTIIVKLTMALKRKPWLWALAMLFFVLASEALFRNRLPEIVATLAGAGAAFSALYFVKFTRFRF
ncbi:MAG: hypothetical protein MJ016_06790 [Victivallaceae bacterium]|nr:hypothetical protein [Victivallaceae bacterium]